MITSFVKPILTILSIPFIVITLGLFLLVINAGLLLLTGWVADKLDIGFDVDRLLAGGRWRHRDHGGHLDRRRPDRGLAIAPEPPSTADARVGTPSRWSASATSAARRWPTWCSPQRVDDAGLAGRVTVSSCGTGDWHVGQPMDERAAATLRAADYDPSPAPGAAVRPPAGWSRNDLVLAMDDTNLDDVRRADPQVAPERVRLFRDFDPVEPGGEVPDPYYGGEQGFEEVLAMVERTCAVLIAALQHADLRRRSLA